MADNSNSDLLSWNTVGDVKDFADFGITVYVSMCVDSYFTAITGPQTWLV